jgi:aspartate/methionine/tyrosine aminotransferase
MIYIVSFSIGTYFESIQFFLQLGDPSSYFPPCPVVVQAIQQHLLQSTGYIPAVGLLSARQAIASHSNRENGVSTLHVTPDHVIVTNGCSGALELLFRAALQPPHDVLLIPCPGFPLYNVICHSLGCQTQSYPMKYNNETEEWYMDLAELETLLQQTNNHSFKAILINNPSNPTGAVFSKTHLQMFLQLCDKYHLMVISDEIYGDMTLHDRCAFHSLANVRNEMIPSPHVPIIQASGLGKQYVVPGWRVGWLVFHDK